MSSISLHSVEDAKPLRRPTDPPDEPSSQKCINSSNSFSLEVSVSDREIPKDGEDLPTSARTLFAAEQLITLCPLSEILGGG